MKRPLAVVDASVVTDALAQSARAPKSRKILSRHRLVTPAHFDAEVLSVLYNLTRGGRMTADRMRRSVALLRRFPASRVPLAGLLAEASILHETLSAYDALYVALGRRLDCALITLNRRLARAPGLGIELVLPIE